jgi:hypothetical protein
MPRSKINCTDCGKEIANTKQGEAVLLEGEYACGRYAPWKIYLHRECYEKRTTQPSEEDG